jgi:PP-loop superfamily ATP-utilizing enzyme
MGSYQKLAWEPLNAAFVEANPAICTTILERQLPAKAKRAPHTIYQGENVDDLKTGVPGGQAHRPQRC